MSRAGALARVRAIVRSRRRLERLNHVLLPQNKVERDKARKRWSFRLMSPLFAVYSALSPDGRALLGLSMFIGLAGIDVGRTQTNLLFGAVSGLLLGSLLVRPFFAPRGLEVRVEAPRRVSAGETLTFSVSLVNTGPRPLLALRMTGPFLPWDGRWVSSRGGVGEIKPGARASLSATARFLARGEHHLDNFAVQLLLPLGLSVGPPIMISTPRFLVVPRIADVRAGADTLMAAQSQQKRRSSRALGETEFIGVRPYRPGDPLKQLHARTWARTGAPHVRVHSAERADDVGIVVCCDGLEATEEAKEGVMSVAAGVAALLVSRGMGIDFLEIDGERAAIEPRQGSAAKDACLDRLATHSFTDEMRPSTLVARAKGLSTLVLVGSAARHFEAAGPLRQRGVLCLCVFVGEPGEAPPVADGLVHTDWRAVERGEAVLL